MTDARRRPLIVVGFNGTAESQEALRWAVDEAAQRNGDLRVVWAYVWPPPNAVYAGEYIVGQPPPADAFRDELDAAVLFAQQRLGDRITRVVKAAPPAHALLDEAHDADLLVVGSRGHNALSAVLLGSVSCTVAAAASCPVVVVRNEADRKESSRAGIIVGVDGSTQSVAATEFGFERAAARSWPLRLIRCWQPMEHIDPAYWDEERQAAHDEEFRDELRKFAAPYVEKYPTVNVSTEAVRGKPGPILVRESVHADMLVVGSRGRGGIAGLLLGSVSQGVLHHSRCTVVVIRNRERAQPETPAA